LPRVAFLADGGLWNNLGTQVIREDHFIAYVGLEDGILRPYFFAPGSMAFVVLQWIGSPKTYKAVGLQRPGPSFVQVGTTVRADTKRQYRASES
jgi:hypothetical protein